jgi:hypothetical protein
MTPRRRPRPPLLGPLVDLGDGFVLRREDLGRGVRWVLRHQTRTSRAFVRKRDALASVAETRRAEGAISASE